VAPSLADRRFESAAKRHHLPTQMLKVGQHLARMALDVRDPIGPSDHAFGIDQVGSALWRSGASFLGRPLRLVGLGDGPVLVGEQPVREAVALGEGAVRLRRVERDPEDLGAGLLERWGSVTEPLALHASPGGVGADVPPQDDPAALEVLQGDRGAVLVRERERRRRSALGEHGDECTGACASLGS
jgi:hypothetical protein